MDLSVKEIGGKINDIRTDEYRYEEYERRVDSVHELFKAIRFNKIKNRAGAGSSVRGCIRKL